MQSPAYRIAGELQVKLRQFLIEHAPRPKPNIVDQNFATRGALLRRGLIRYVHRFADNHAECPHHTELTELGREVVCIILGQYADSIIASREFLARRQAPTIAPDQELKLARQWANELEMAP